MRRDSNTCSTDTDTDTSNPTMGYVQGMGAGNQGGLTAQLPPAASKPGGEGTLGTSGLALPFLRCQGERDTLPREGRECH